MASTRTASASASESSSSSCGAVEPSLTSSCRGWRASLLELSWHDEQQERGQGAGGCRTRRRSRPGPGVLVAGRPTMTPPEKDDDDEGRCRSLLVATGVAEVRIPVHVVIDLGLLPKASSSDGVAVEVEVAARSAVADYVARNVLLVVDGAAHPSIHEEDRDFLHGPENSNNDSRRTSRPPGQAQQYYSFKIETLDQKTSRQDADYSSTTSSSSQRTNGRRHRRLHRRRPSNGQMLPPYVLDRTDIYCRCRDGDLHDNNKAQGELFVHVNLRVVAYRHGGEVAATNNIDDEDMEDTDESGFRERLAAAATRHMEQWVRLHGNAPELLRHVATAVFQERLRYQLEHGHDDDGRAVAFVANGSILPRKNGNSTLPMASPPALPFVAPHDSPMTATIHVPMGALARHVRLPLSAGDDPPTSSSGLLNGSSVVSVTGLLVPRGVTLIVGGGYHGKSTLLRALAVGVYNKIPGDGREFCVTTNSAVSVRAEDGRYVNNCNVSAFITNLPKIGPRRSLPTPAGEPEAASSDDAATAAATVTSSKKDATTTTQHFSTGEASGSTSQAANVCEAIEMGATAMLVDEDVSAANFMARDGRMRSLVADESITPLLYRVNGMYSALGISTVVVVGGVGDWLDVPDAVILMQNYQCYDATSKARSISRQFSHGHVQYAGRGVVHRLPWDKSGSSVPLPVDAPPPKHTPIPRRPADAFCQLLRRDRTAVRLLDGSDALALDPLESDEDGDAPMGGDDNGDVDDDDGEYVMDLSRCEQLVGKKMQLYGVGLCVLHVLELALRHPNVGMADLLRRMDEHLDKHGMASLVDPIGYSMTREDLVERVGFAYRPRRFEVGQALARLRGVRLHEIELEDDGAETAAAMIAEAERKKREMLELWNSRRKNKLNS